MYELGLVDSFDVDACTLKPDCVACTEGKLTIKPFKMSPNPLLMVGEHQYLDRTSGAPSKPLTPAFIVVTHTTNPSCAPLPLSLTEITPTINVPIAEAY